MKIAPQITNANMHGTVVYKVLVYHMLSAQYSPFLSFLVASLVLVVVGPEAVTHNGGVAVQGQDSSH